MAVFYNSKSGAYVVASQSLNPAAEANFLGQEALLHTGTGWHEYSTLADMEAAVKSNHWPTPKSGTDPANLPSEAVTGATNSVPGVSSVEQFLSMLTEKNLWIRVAKVVIGGTLLIVGISHISGADTAIARAARKVPLPI